MKYIMRYLKEKVNYSRVRGLDAELCGDGDKVKVSFESAYDCSLNNLVSNKSFLFSICAISEFIEDKTK